MQHNLLVSNNYDFRPKSGPLYGIRTPFHLPAPLSVNFGIITWAYEEGPGAPAKWIGDQVPAGRGADWPAGSNHDSRSRKVTTLPTTMMAGPLRFAASTFAAMSSIVPVTTR